MPIGSITLSDEQIFNSKDYTPGDREGAHASVHRSQRNQYAAVTDLLAHGEIEGLVGGPSGVYYNEVPLVPAAQAGDTAFPQGTLYLSKAYHDNYGSDKKVFKDPDDTFKGNSGAVPRRHALIEKAFSLTTSGQTAKGGETLFTEGLNGAPGTAGFAIKLMLEHCYENSIAIAAHFSHSGTDYQIIVKPAVVSGEEGGISGTDINIPNRLDILAATTGDDSGCSEKGAPHAISSGTTFYLDWGGILASISSSDSKLMTFKDFSSKPDSDTGGTYQGDQYGALTYIRNFASNSPADIVIYPEQEGGAQVKEVQSTFKDTFVKLRRGTRYQQGGGATASSPTSSFMIGGSAVGGELHMYDGITNASSQPIEEGSSSTLTTSAGVLIGAGAFNFGQYTKKEVDGIDIDLEFPGGLFASKGSGEDIRVFVEHQVIFEYKKAEDNENEGFRRVLVLGKDYGGFDYVDELAYPNGKARWLNLERGSDRFFEMATGADRLEDNLEVVLREGSGVTYGYSQVNPFIETIKVDLTPFKPFTDWRIRVRRLVPSPRNEFWSTDSNQQSQSSSRIKTVTAHIREKLSYPLAAFSTVGFSAQDFPSPPSRAYHLKGRRLRVPTNYFSRDELGTHEAKYTRHVSNGTDEEAYQTWDGNFRGDTSTFTTSASTNFKRVYCNNPAWVFYDILLDKDYGLGEFIQEEDIDKYALYQIARYCDEMVPDGKGGTEPRFTCNVYLSKQVEAYKVLKDLSSTFRAMMYWIDGKITAVQDRPKEPVYTFTTGNIKDGIFDYSYTGSKARVNQVRASWNDPKDFYRNTVVAVDDIPNIIKQGRTISKNVVAFGCTSQGQARRVAQWHLDTDIRETEIVTFTSSLNAGFLRPGDIINVQDKRVAGIISSGRVISGSTSQVIKLDRTVNFPGGVAGNQCNIYVLYPDPGVYLQQESGTFNGLNYKRGELLQAYRTTGNDASTAVSLLTGATQEIASKVKDDSGNAAMVSFSPHSRVEVEAISNATLGTSASIINTEGAFAGGAPAADAIWAISREDNVAYTEVKKYRILGIKEEAVNEYTIAASQYAPEKFDEIEQEKPVSRNAFIDASTRDEVVPGPGSVAANLVLNSDTGSYDAIISWSTPTHSVTDSNGASFTRAYPYIKSFNVYHNFLAPLSRQATSGADDGSVVTVEGRLRTLRVSGVAPGAYDIGVETVNDTKGVSERVKLKVTLLAQGKGILSRKETLPNIQGFEGTLSHSAGVITISNGTVTTGAETFGGITGGSFNFTSMPNSSKAFLYFDASAAAYKRILVHEDTVSLNNFAYLKEITSGDNGLIKCNGTANLKPETLKVPGTGTNFTSDFSVGDLVKFSTSSAAGTQVANSEYRIVRQNLLDGQELTISAVLFDRTSNNSGILGSGTGATVHVFKQAFKPDFEKDAIVATLNKDSSGTITMEALPYVPTNANATRNESKGAWSSGTAYKVGDMVTFGGSSYVATSDHTSTGSNDPQDSSAPWSLLSSKGDEGDPGPAAKVANLESTDYSIVYNEDGGAPSFTSPDGNSNVVRLTATSQGYDTPEFRFLRDGTQIQDWSTANTTADITYSGTTFSSSDTKDVIKVQVRENSSDSSPVEDSVAIIKIKQGADGDPGSDAYTVALTNDSYTLPASSSGAVTSHTGSGTAIFVYKGGTLLDSIKTGTPGPGQFKVTAITATNITAGSTVDNIDITDDEAVVADHTGMSTSASTAKIEYTINVENTQTIKKLQTFTKSQEGAAGEGTEVIYYVSKSAPNTPTASTVDNLGTGWSTNVPTATENVWVSLGSRAAGATNYTWGAPSLLQEVTSNLLLNEKMLPWEVGTGNATVPGGTWPDNGTTAENTRSLLTDPFGGKSVIWRAINSGTDDNADGGFHSPQVEINPTKEYRFSLFINQKNSTNGRTYFGLNGYNASGTNTALEENNGSGDTTTNPYFWSGDLPTLDKWYLLIAYLVPHNDTDETIHPDSGIWDPATGKKVTISDDYYDFKFQSTHTKARMRAYQYYNESSSSDEVHFFAPRIDIADERMPSVNDVLRIGPQGAEGDPGRNSAVVYAYQRADTTPSSKPDTATTYTFATGASNPSSLGNGWSSVLSAGSGNNLYVCTAAVSSTGATISIPTTAWGDIVILAEKGIKGDDAAGKEYIFAVTANENTAPSTTGIDNFGYDSPSSPWSDGAQQLTSTNKALWRAERDIKGSPDAGDTVEANFSTPVVVGRFATDGEPSTVAGPEGPAAYSAVPTRESFAFLADTLGEVSNLSGFALTFDVKKGTQSFTYDNESPYAANSYRYTSISTTNVSIDTDTNGQITVDGGTLVSTGVTTLTGEISVTIHDNTANTTIGVRKISFSKLLAAARGGSEFTFEESSTTGITATYAASWAGTLTNDAAQAIGTAVTGASSDGYIRPNDRITVTDNSENKAGTRVYTGSAIKTGTIPANSFSDLVVQAFDGSVIVDGTLSADTLSSNTTLSNNITVGSTLTVSSDGIIRSSGSSYSEPSNGFFLGYDGGAAKFKVGSSTNYLDWSGSSLNVKGDITATSLSLESNVEIDYGSITGGPPSNATQNRADSDTDNLIGQKSKVFRSASRPTSVNAGDLWIDTDDNNKLYVSTQANSNATEHWVLSQDAVGEASAAQTAATTAAATAANSADKTAGTIGGWYLNESRIYSNGHGNTSLPSDATFLGSTGMVLRKQGAIHAKNFYINEDGDAGFKGDLTGASGTFSGSLTAESGTIGGVSIGASKLYLGTGTHGNSNTKFYVDDDGKFSLGDKLSWNGTDLTINGSITLTNAASISLSSFSNDAGFTDDSAASTAQAAANTAQATANTANNKSSNFDTDGDINSGIDVSSSGHIRGGLTSYAPGDSNQNGFFLGYEGGAYKFKIGNGHHGSRMYWDGSHLTVAGTISTNSGMIGTWTLQTQALYSGTLYNNGNFDTAVSGHYFTSEGITINGGGGGTQASIHAKNFYIDTQGNAVFRGSVTSAATISGTLASTVVSNAESATWDLYASKDNVAYRVYTSGSGTIRTPSAATTTVQVTAKSGSTTHTADIAFTVNSVNTTITPGSITNQSHTGKWSIDTESDTAAADSTDGIKTIRLEHDDSGKAVTISYSLINLTQGIITCCFTGETKVAMADGSEKNIEDIIVGDIVKTETGSAKVSKLHPTFLTNRVLYSINDGPAFVTAEHPFRTKEGWKSFSPAATKYENFELYSDLAGALSVNDEILCVDGTYKKLNSKKEVEGSWFMSLYNFSVEGDDHSYFANGYCVHNKS